ncbi:MAG: MFS transporter [Anaerolineae bacterium]|nr:MFS transporter [Anaerolineae bacterium]
MSGLIGYVGFILAPTWEWVMLGALFGQIGVSLVSPSFQAYIAEQAPEGKTSSTFGLINGLFLICRVIGPITGGLLAYYMGYRVLLWISTGVYSVSTIMRVWMARGTRFEMQRLQPRELVRDISALRGLLLAGGLLTWLFIVDGLIDASGQMTRVFMPKYLTDVGGINASGFGALMALMNLVSAITMWPAGRLADRVGERRVIALGLALMSSAWFVLAGLPYHVLFVVVFTAIGIARALIEPAFSALISKSVPKESLGITWGVFMTALGVLAIPAPYLGGLIYNHVAPHATFIVAACAALIALPLALRHLHAPPQPETTSITELVTPCPPSQNERVPRSTIRPHLKRWFPQSRVPSAPCTRDRPRPPCL